MSHARNGSIFDRLSQDLEFRGGGPVEAAWERGKAEEAEEGPQSRFGRGRWLLLDFGATFAWIYVLMRLFVGDFERWILTAVKPEWQWVLDFRFFLFLFVLAGVALFFKKKYLWIPLYMFFFPVIILVWKVPRALYKRGSWTIALGVIHVAIASIRGIRFSILAAALVAFSSLTIIVSESKWPLTLASPAILVLWVVLLLKAFRYALTPARFVTTQRRLFDKVLSGKMFWSLVSVDEKHRGQNVEVLDREQSQQVLARVGFGLIAYRGSQLWSYQLDRYRRSGASIIFSAASVIGLIIQGVISFTLVNFAVFKVDPSQFSINGSTSLAMFSYYSFASLFVSEISVIAPAGGVAAALSVTAGFSAAVVVMILIATVFFGFRQSKSDEAANQEIRQLREQGDHFAERLGEEYDLTVEELFRRVADLGWDLLGILAYLTRSIPEPPLEDQDSSRL